MHVRTMSPSGRPTGDGKPDFMDKRRRPRPALLLAIVLAHLLVIAWLVTRPAEKIVLKRGGTVLALSNFAPEKPPSAPPRPLVVRPLIKPVLIVPAPEPAAEIDPSPAASAAVAGVPGQCTLANDTRAEIMRDPAAMAELAALPLGVRTEAGAVMVWNGAWVELAVPASLVPGAAAAPDALRMAIVKVIEGTPAPCREEPVAGPVFMAIPEAARTTFLVIGSGIWHWADLLGATADCVVSPATNCPKPNAYRPIF
jgi:hypothetical protein